jgi:hypothetical protein
MLSTLLLAVGLALVSVRVRPKPRTVKPPTLVAEATPQPFAEPPPPPPRSRSTKLKRITIGGSVKQSFLIRQVYPIFPPEMKGRDFAGGLHLRFAISSEEIPRDVQVIHSGMHPKVTQAIVEAVRQYRYAPTLLNGKAVEVESQMDVTYCF